MRFVSIGDLITDFYYKNNKFLGVCGGNTSHNIIANLAVKNIKTLVLGVCGNDKSGNIAIKSLEELNVDVSKVKILDSIRTRCLHVSYFDTESGVTFESKRRCPFCGEKLWYMESSIDPDYVLKNITKEDFLVFDNLNSKNQEIIDKTKNIKVIDIGQYFEFEKIDDETLINKIKNKFEYINFNERVTIYLLDRFKLKSNVDIFNLFKPKFMTITKGEEGAIFFYNGKEYSFKLLNKADVTIDPTGAGDAFVSSILYNLYKCGFKYDPKLFENWYSDSCELTKIVVSKMGARGHIYSLYPFDVSKNKCSCDF